MLLLPIKALLFLALILSTREGFSEEAACLEVKGLLSCELAAQAQVTLKIKKNEIKELKDFGAFEKEVKSYLEIHNQIKHCPGFKEKCPSFSFQEFLNGTNGIIVKRNYSSYGQSCTLGTPADEYLNESGKILAMKLGSNIQIKIDSDCGNGQSMSFVAYKEGLLVAAANESSRFESQAVGRRIILGPSEVRAESSDGKTFRIAWKGKKQEHWIEIDPVTRSFKASNFMEVDQFNSGKCEVKKQPQPEQLCNKMRKKLIEHGSIKIPDEYECMEHVPVIKGIASRITRG